VAIINGTRFANRPVGARETFARREKPLGVILDSPTSPTLLICSLAAGSHHRRLSYLEGRSKSEAIAILRCLTPLSAAWAK
jgi:hypothetical protein